MQILKDMLNPGKLVSKLSLGMKGAAGAAAATVALEAGTQILERFVLLISIYIVHLMDND